MIERFLAKVNKTDACWLWTASLDTGGYGQFWDGTRLVGAHLWIYEQIHGPIIDARVVDHKCRVHNCVNPEHLQLITSRDNILLGVGLAAENARKTVCVRGHSLENNVYYHKAKNGHPRRVCKTCHKMRRDWEI